MEAPAGPPRFECPEEFAASPFAPGPPFSTEVLQDPSKQLLLIRAPAAFSPESLDGQVISLSGLQTLKVLQPDRMQKVYNIQATPGEVGSSAHLLIPSGHMDQLTCAPTFSGSLNIWERYGDPTASQPLSPVADRPAPQIPEGLKQRFLPFGGQLRSPHPPPWEAAEKPPKKKKKKHLLPMAVCMGDPEERLSLMSEPWVGRGPEMPPSEATMPAEDLHSSSSLGVSSQESLLLAEETVHKSRKKKRKKKEKEETVEEGELQHHSSINQQPEFEPPLPGEPESGAAGDAAESSGMAGLVQRKHKKKRKRGEEAAARETMALMDPASIKEEAAIEPWELCGLGVTPEARSVLVAEGPEMAQASHKAKKKKQRHLKREEEQEAGRLWMEPSSVKQEPLSCVELEAPSGAGARPGAFADTAVEVPGQKRKKKKKKHKRELAEEGLDCFRQDLKTQQE